MKNRRGMVLVAALLIMAVMTIVGAASITTSRIDIQISTNTRTSRQVFFLADGGLEMSPKLIRRFIDLGKIDSIDNLSIDDPGLFNEIMGYVGDDDAGDLAYPQESGDPKPDVQVVNGDKAFLLDIDRSGQRFMYGSGAEFSAGSEGAGAGSSGGLLIFYTVNSLASGTNSAVSRLDVYYRYVPGVAVDKSLTDEPDDFYEGKIAGILQRIENKAYWGNSWFYAGTGNRLNGAFISNAIGCNLTNMVTDLENTGADTWTPLAEAYYIVSQYFKQESPDSSLSYAQGATGSFNNTMDPYYAVDKFVYCAKSFVLLITDGASTKDGEIPASLKDFDNDGADSTSCVESTNSNCNYPDGGTDFLDDVALYARTTDLRDDLDGDQNLILYAIYAFGDDANARQLLKDAAKNGGFEDKNGNKKPDLTEEWDKNNDGLPDTYFEASDGYALQSQLMAAITDILQRAASGTAVSVLATSSEGEGTLVQAYFKPVVPVGVNDVKWVGYLHNLWVDAEGRIREDTVNQGSRPGLVLTEDKIVDFYFDSASGEAKFHRFELDSNGDKQKGFNDDNSNGILDNGETWWYIYTDHLLDELEPIWEGGQKLLTRDSSTRVIKTFADLNYDGVVDSAEYMDFSTSNLTNITPFLGVKDDTTWSYLGASQAHRAENLIKYVRGDASGYLDSVSLRYRTIDGNIWKLGDIIHSTPLSIGRPLDNYGLIYGDQSYQEYYTKYRDRETMVYVGGNDGMLHAFYMGKYTVGDDSETTNVTEKIYFDKATGTTADYGQELWAYIPQSLLPHLKWLPREDYAHVYYVDLKPRVVDAQIFADDDVHPNGWGTVLIGGLNLGGKSIPVEDDFTTTPTSRTYSSSYFAMDVTDPHNPILLWEKSYTGLGLTTSIPTVAKIGTDWFAMFGSGPTDLDGTSDQESTFFVVDLDTGVLRASFTGDEDDAFMGSPITVDVGLNYNVDTGYIGESYSTNQGWKGTMYRFRSKDENGYISDPASWTFSNMFEADGPITAAGSASFDFSNNLWVYFGTGRYLSQADKTDTNTHYFYGLKDPYYNTTMYTETTAAALDPARFDLLDTTAAKVYTDKTVTGVTGVTNWAGLLNTVSGKDGWKFSLGTEAANIGERVLNKPTVLGGIVFDTSFVPNADICGFDGDSNIVGIFYTTGTSYYKEVFGTGGSTQTDVDGVTKTEVNRKTEVGIGRGSGVSIHVGGQEGVTGYVQQSTGIVESLELEPAYKVRSGFTCV